MPILRQWHAIEAPMMSVRFILLLCNFHVILRFEHAKLAHAAGWWLKKNDWTLNNNSNYTESSQTHSLTMASAASVYEFELIGFACRLTFPLKRPAATFTTWHKAKRRVGFCSLMVSHAILWTTNLFVCLLVCVCLCKQVSIEHIVKNIWKKQREWTLISFWCSRLDHIRQIVPLNRLLKNCSGMRNCLQCNHLSGNGLLCPLVFTGMTSDRVFDGFCSYKVMCQAGLPTKWLAQVQSLRLQNDAPRSK